jgi:hypothetical protein
VAPVAAAVAVPVVVVGEGRLGDGTLELVGGLVGEVTLEGAGELVDAGTLEGIAVLVCASTLGVDTTLVDAGILTGVEPALHPTTRRSSTHTAIHTRRTDFLMINLREWAQPALHPSVLK